MIRSKRIHIGSTGAWSPKITHRHTDAHQFSHQHLLQWLGGLLTHVRTNASLAVHPAWLEGLQTMLADEYPKIKSEK